MKRAALALAGLALAASLAGCGGTKTVTVTTTRTVTVTRTVTGPTTPPANAAPCTGGDLHGTFTALAGSAGAGHIVYTLTLTNAGNAACWVSGLPVVQLLDGSGNGLPTQVIAGRPGVATAAKVTLVPGAAAGAQARFSPDVQGVGDSTTGPCQPTASTLRVTPNGGGTLDVAISPPTSVCEQGQLQFDLLAAAG